MPLTPDTPPRRHTGRRIAVLGLLAALLVAVIYGAGALLAPVPATAAVTTSRTAITPPKADLVWPAFGAAAVGVTGQPGLLGSHGSTASVPIASITKTVTALVILHAKPISAGSGGPNITFSQADVDTFHRVQANGGSWAPVVAGATFTERQAIETMLLESANNYAISLATWAFGSVPAYVAAANDWLEAKDLDNTHVVDASGLDRRSVSSTADAVELGKLVLANPVLEPIVGTATDTMPAIGAIDNTNKLLGIAGIDGIKTGSTDYAGDCLLFSADATIGDRTITIVGVVLGAPSHEALWPAVTALLKSVKAGFHVVPLAHAGEGFAHYETLWGQRSALVAAKGAALVVWSDTPVTVAVTARPVQVAISGARLGSVVFTSGDDRVSVPLQLKTPVGDPGILWRLLHPAALRA